MQGFVDKPEYNGNVLDFNSPWLNGAEMLSGNTKASARSLAKLGTFMANGGKTKGLGKIMSKNTWNKFHANGETVYDIVVSQPTTFTDGGVAYFDEPMNPDSKTPNMDKIMRMSNGFYGWMGFGGSSFQWNPE